MQYWDFMKKEGVTQLCLLPQAMRRFISATTERSVISDKHLSQKTSREATQADKS